MQNAEFGINPDRQGAEEYWKLKPEWAHRDQIVEDLAFTMGVVHQFKPRQMLEIGVSAGVTSGALLWSANQHGDAFLDGVDIATTVYYDDKRRVGEVVDSLAPELRSRYSLHLNKTAIDVCEMDKTFDLAFIDGNHAHPWATFDLLCILPRLARRSVVILHDIHYFCTHSQGGFCLFESVQVTKAKSANIGCLLIEDNIELLLEGIYNSLTMNWQDVLPAESISKLGGVLESHFGRDVSTRFSGLLQSKYDEYVRSFRIYKYIRQQQWGREMESRRIAAGYKDVLSSKAS